MSQSLPLIAGNAALDLVNTVGGIRSGRHDDQLQTYADVLTWAIAARVVDEGTRQSLTALALVDPAAAEAALTDARAMREALHRIFRAVTRREAPKAADLDRLGRDLAEAQAGLDVVAVGSGFALQWAQPPSLAQPIWGAVRAAGSLLVDGPIHRVRECCGDTCGWLFLDVSKNGSRLWCDMAVCGNRHKVARYRRRKARIAIS